MLLGRLREFGGAKRHQGSRGSGVTKGPADQAVRGGGGRHLRGAPNRHLNVGQFRKLN